MSRLLTVTEAATVLGLSRTAMYELVRSGHVHSIRIPIGEGRAIRVPRTELDAFVERQLEAQAAELN